MLAYVSVCERNISDAASTDIADIRNSASTRAIPRSRSSRLWLFFMIVIYGKSATTLTGVD